jgi:hypothetical protein
VCVQLCKVKNIVETIITYEKSRAGFGSITQVMALRPVYKRLMTHASGDTWMSSELPGRFNYAGFMRDA